MYGLESAQLNDTAKRRIDAFQLKGLRKILNLKTTYVDRNNTNQRVYEQAQEKVNEGLTEGSKSRKTIQRLSEYYEDKRRQVTLGIIKHRNTGEIKAELDVQGI